MAARRDPRGSARGVGRWRNRLLLGSACCTPSSGRPTPGRRRLMAEHIRAGHKFPAIQINTAYSFGLDDQDFVVAFEGDDPKEFVTLLMRLRETDASRYTVRDTPQHTCARKPLEAILAALG